MVGTANVGTKNTSIGIATWGVVAKKESLTVVDKRFTSSSRRGGVGTDGNTFSYHLGSYLVEKGLCVHCYFSIRKRAFSLGSVKQ